MKSKFVLWFDEISIKDVAQVGGKNASLGEMRRVLTKKGIDIPDGFAVTSEAFWYFLKKSQIPNYKLQINPKSKIQNLKQTIEIILNSIDVKNISDLSSKSRQIRNLILNASFPADLEGEIIKAYQILNTKYKILNTKLDVAVRSSATAEDLPRASYAGQLESYLNIRGESQLLETIKKCFASLYSARTISYSFDHKIDHKKILVSVGVQKMVRSDRASAGVMFTLDTESGFRDVVMINGAYGLGENVVKGRVVPDQFLVFKSTLGRGFKPIISKTLGTKKKKLIYTKNLAKPTKNVDVAISDQKKFILNNDEILTLTRWACQIEEHYKMPQDIEWAKDGLGGKLYIVQSRPETVHRGKEIGEIEEYILKPKAKNQKPKILCKGLAIGSKIGQGKARIIPSIKNINKFKDGEVLVTTMTDPDWVIAMRKARAIVTDSGGRTCFSGDTNILTDKGFLPICEVVKKYSEQNLKVLSLNKKTLKLEWQKVIDGMQRKAKILRVNISQTGRMKDNFLDVTASHKFLTFKNRKLISKELRQILNNNQLILSPVRIPEEEQFKLTPQLGYLLGGISTDGHIHLARTHGEVQFIQKSTPEKRLFIEKISNCLKKIFRYSFHISIKKVSSGKIRNRSINGTALAFRCYSKKIALKLLEEQQRLSVSLLKGSRGFVYNFLAGAIDGDGTYSESSNRINIFCSKKYLLQAIIIACLRLNINFQISINRGIYNIQIVDKIEEILKYTARVKGDYKRIKFGTRFFAARQLLEDIQEKINYKGRIKPYINNNLLIDVEKIKNYVIPIIKGQMQNHELTHIINSDLKMLRVNFIKSLAFQQVYNITIKNNHNYVVFTKRYTPVVVNNCHAAIVSRELGVPCIVGTGNATQKIKNRQKITVACSEGEEGKVYAGLVPYQIKKIKISHLRRPKTKIMMNVGEPDRAFSLSFIPNDGVGLAREEFIISNYIKIHPRALLEFNKLRDKKLKKQIGNLTFGYKNKSQFFVDKLAEGAAKIAAAFYPKEVILRFSDFKTNEYAGLIGGNIYEPKEENPMLGWRGASRYYDCQFESAFGLECRAVKKVREEFGLDNLIIMIPFCRTPEEGEKVITAMKKFGLNRYERKDTNEMCALKIYVMCEIPSNVLLAQDFAKIFDGFSIGSNDLTQLILGVDRDSKLVAHIFDERSAAVKKMIAEVIKTAHKYKRKVGVCGDAPSTFPDFASFLVQRGIDSISLSPDAVLKTTLEIIKTEKKKRSQKGSLLD